MSRKSRARRARLWTLAGLTFLSGCGGATSDPLSSTATTRVTPSSASVPSASLPSRHTLDAAVVPVWYPFDDPPMPALLPADGVVDAHAEAVPSRPEPTVVRPPAASGEFKRLPPVGEPNESAFEDSRYDIDSRYSLDGTAQEPAPGDATEPTVEPAAAEPNVDAPSQQRSGWPQGTFQRLPSVDHAPPEAPVENPTAVEPSPSVTPNLSFSPQSSAPSPRMRPSDLFAEEARPIERREHTATVDPPASRSFQRLDSPIVASPGDQSPYLQSPYVAPQTIAPPVAVHTEPIVLPPVDASVGDGTSWAAASPPRHREMQLINDRAAEGVRAGFALAHRGALYSAQAEFAAALRIIAQALDAQDNGTRHVESLAAGLAALDESEDFLAPARSTAAPVDVAAIVAKHRTPVLKDAPREDLTPITALQRYYTFAQEQLAASVEHEPAASQALYGMGKVQTTLQASRTGTVADGPKAIALHQAALLVDDRNFMAANELGVLMARCGRYDAARAALAHSVSISPQPAVWRNLAAVHDRLGETTLAANARAAANSSHTASKPSMSATMPQQPVVWLDPAAFAQSAQPQADLQRGQPTAAPAVDPSTVPRTSEKKSGFKWPLW